MGTIKSAKRVLNEARSSKEISGYIDMQDPLTLANPLNPQIVIIGVGKMDYKGLKVDVERKTRDLYNFAKKGNWKFLYKQLGKIDDYSDGYESVYQSYVRTLIQVEEKMQSGSYKRRITMAKNTK